MTWGYLFNRGIVGLAVIYLAGIGCWRTLQVSGARLKNSHLQLALESANTEYARARETATGLASRLDTLSSELASVTGQLVSSESRIRRYEAAEPLVPFVEELVAGLESEQARVKDFKQAQMTLSTAIRSVSDVGASIAFSPGGEVYAVTIPGGGTTLRSIKDGRDRGRLGGEVGRALEHDVFPPGHTDSVFSPDGQHLAVAEGQGGVRLWDLRTREIVWHRRFGDGRFLALGVFPRGDKLCLLSIDGSVRIVDLRSGEERARFQVLRSFVPTDRSTPILSAVR